MHEFLNDSGIVLGLQNLKDSGLIVRWLTESHGRIDSVASSARLPSSPFSGHLGLFNQCSINVKFSPNRELHQLRECQVSIFPAHLSQSVKALGTVSLAASMIELLTEKQTPLQDVYQHFSELITCLNPLEPHEILRNYVQFECRFLDSLSLLPEEVPDQVRSFSHGNSMPEPDFVPRYFTYIEKVLARHHMTGHKRRKAYLYQFLSEN